MKEHKCCKIWCTKSFLNMQSQQKQKNKRTTTPKLLFKINIPFKVISCKVWNWVKISFKRKMKWLYHVSFFSFLDSSPIFFWEPINFAYFGATEFGIGNRESRGQVRSFPTQVLNICSFRSNFKIWNSDRNIWNSGFDNFKI